MIGIAHPRTYMHFVYRERTVQSVSFFPVSHPPFVTPLIPCCTYDRSRFRWQFGHKCKRVALFEFFALMGRDVIFIYFSDMYIVDHSFPDTTFIPTDKKLVTMRIPTVEIPNNRHRLCIWSPHRKVNTLSAIDKDSLRA